MKGEGKQILLLRSDKGGGGWGGRAYIAMGEGKETSEQISQ